MVGEGGPRRQRQGQRNHDAHASTAAVSGFNRELPAERLNAFLHAAKPETRRLACREAQAVVAHRQFEAAARSFSPNRNRLLPISIILKLPKSGKPDFGGGRRLG